MGYWVKLKFKYGCVVAESIICTDILEVDDAKVTYSTDICKLHHSHQIILSLSYFLSDFLTLSCFVSGKCGFEVL